MKHNAADTIIEKQFDRNDFHRTMQDLRKNDPESADLMLQVYMYFKKRLEFTSNENEAWNRLHWVINQGKASPLARNNIFKAAHALGIKLPSMFFAASETKSSGMHPQLEKYLLHGGKTPEPGREEKIQESMDLFTKYGWKVRKVFRLGNLIYTRFEYKDGYETDIPETILEQPSRVKQEFLPALVKTFDMVSRWATSQEPMTYKRLLQYIEAKGFRRPASEYAYIAAAEYLKGKGFELFHDFKTASRLEQEWGSMLKTAWGPSTEGKLDKAEEIVGNLKASPYVDKAYIADSWMDAADIVWVRVEIRPKIQDDARPGANTLRLKSEIGKQVSRYRLQTDKFLSPKQNWTHRPDEVDSRTLLRFYKEHPYIWEFRYRIEE